MASYINNTLNIGKDSPDDVVETMSIEVDAVGTNLTSHGPWTFSPLLDSSVISSIDHGGLTGLGDDDHTQYVLADGTRQITGDQDIVGSLDVDNLNIDGNEITSTDTNGNITLNPNGTGMVLAEANALTVSKPGTGYRIAMNATSDGYITIRDDAAASKVVLRSNGNSYFDGGNVGIGPDTTPDYKLDVQGTLHADGAITGDSTLDVTGAITGSSLNANGGITAGVNDTTRGVLSLYGASTTNGGTIVLYSPANYETPINHWTMENCAGYLRILDNTATNRVYFNQTTTRFNAARNDVDFIVDGDTRGGIFIVDAGTEVVKILDGCTVGGTLDVTGTIISNSTIRGTKLGAGISPTNLLDLYSSSAEVRAKLYTPTVNDAVLELNSDDGASYVLFKNSSGSGIYTAGIELDDFYIYNNGDFSTGDPSITIYGSGNVAINNAPDDAALSVVGSYDNNIAVFKDTSGTIKRIVLVNSTNAFSLTANGTDLEFTRYDVSISGTPITCEGSGTIKLYQYQSAAAVPVVEIKQDDTNQAFINYVGTSGASTTTSITTLNRGDLDAGGWACGGLVQIEVNGSQYWIPFYEP